MLAEQGVIGGFDRRPTRPIAEAAERQRQEAERERREAEERRQQELRAMQRQTMF